MHKLHENDKTPPRSVAEAWHQVAMERAKRIRELEKALDSEHYQCDRTCTGKPCEVCDLLSERREEAYHPTV